MPRADGPFEVLERINDNDYKINLPSDFEVSATFNVADLSPFYPTLPHQIWGSNLFNKGRMMESYLDKALIKM